MFHKSTKLPKAKNIQDIRQSNFYHFCETLTALGKVITTLHLEIIDDIVHRKMGTSQETAIEKIQTKIDHCHAAIPLTWDLFNIEASSNNVSKITLLQNANSSSSSHDYYKEIYHRSPTCLLSNQQNCFRNYIISSHLPSIPRGKTIHCLPVSQLSETRHQIFWNKSDKWGTTLFLKLICNMVLTHSPCWRIKNFFIFVNPQLFICSVSLRIHQNLCVHQHYYESNFHSIFIMIFQCFLKNLPT